MFALYLPPICIGTSLECRRMITDTSNHNRLEIIRMKFTN